MSAAVNVQVQYATSVVALPDRKLIAACVSEAINAARPAGNASLEAVVRIVDEDEIRALNKQFRHTDKSTNVLAFPAGDEDLAALRGGARKTTLGDLVICGPVVLREAAEQHKRPEDHWLHLLVHGTLHLLGYDHQDEQDASEMETLEIRILAKRGIDDPYRVR